MLLLALCAGGLPPPPFADGGIPDPVATVDGQPIGRADYKFLQDKLWGEMGREWNMEHGSHTHALTRLVRERVEAQYAKKHGIVPDPKLLEERYLELSARLDVKAFGGEASIRAEDRVRVMHLMVTEHMHRAEWARQKKALRGKAPKDFDAYLEWYVKEYGGDPLTEYPDHVIKETKVVVFLPGVVPEERTRVFGFRWK